MPYDVQINFWREPVSRWAEDALAAVVVDASQLRDGRDLDATFEQQVSSADLLLLSKSDLVTETELPRLEGMLREIEPEAPIVRVVRGDLDPRLLFPPRADARRADRVDAAGSPPEHDHEHFASEILPVQPGIPADELLGRLRETRALRIKGFVDTSDGIRLVQGVGPRIELVDPGADPPAALIGRVVLIRRA